MESFPTSLTAVDNGSRQGEEGEEEVDDVFARLREQHLLRLSIYEELHAKNGGGGGGRHS